MSLAVVEPEVEPFDPQIYFPQELAGIVHFIGALRQERQSRALIMPNGSVEIAFFLERDQTTEFYLGDDSPSDRTQRNEFSLVFSVANRPQIVAGRRIHVILAMMTPAAAMLILGIPASELANRTVAPLQLGIDVRPLEDLLKTLPNFTLRARAIDSWLATRLRAAEGVPEFLSFRRKFVDLFRDGRKVPEVDQMMDLTGAEESAFPKAVTLVQHLSRCDECTFSAHRHLSHSNTIHAKPRPLTGIRNVS